MGFLDRKGDPSERQQPQAEQDSASEPSAERLQSEVYRAGSLEGLPQSGRERLARMKEDIARGFFTSDLSVNEFLLVKEAGFEPLGLVLGSSIYHIGFQQANWNQNQEMTGPDPGDVPRPRAGDDAHGGGGRPARRATASSACG